MLCFDARCQRELWWRVFFSTKICRKFARKFAAPEAKNIVDKISVSLYINAALETRDFLNRGVGSAGSTTQSVTHPQSHTEAIKNLISTFPDFRGFEGHWLSWERNRIGYTPQKVS